VRLVVILLSLIAVLPAWAEPETGADAKSDAAAVRVKVAEPFVEIHTGPGRGYPVFHVVERDAPLTLEYRRAGWIKVSTVRGRVGWVPREALLATLDGSEQTPEMKSLGQEAFQAGHWQASVLMGELDEVSSLAFALGYRMTENLSAEAMFTQASGPFANNKLIDINLQHEMFPRWRVSPYVMLGTGRAKIEPRATVETTTGIWKNGNSVSLYCSSGIPAAATAKRGGGTRG
jgi:uncharacterized protein YgiM (DUF1202 family)